MTRCRVTIPMIARMRALHGIGLSYEAIGRVIALDYGGEQPSKRTVFHYTAQEPRRGFTRKGGAGVVSQ